MEITSPSVALKYFAALPLVSVSARTRTPLDTTPDSRFTAIGVPRRLEKCPIHLGAAPSNPATAWTRSEPMSHTAPDDSRPKITPIAQIWARILPAPRWMGYFSKRLGTPIGVNLLSGVVSSGVLVLALTLTSGNAAKYFSATLGLVISMVTFTYVLIFPAVIRLRYKYPNIDRPYRIPGGTVGLWVAGILTTAWAAFTTIAVIYPGIGTASPDNSLPSGFTGERTQYTLSQVIPLGVMILIGLLFYALGRRTRQQLQPGVAAAEAVLAGDGATPAASGPTLSGDGTTSMADGEAAASDVGRPQPPSSTQAP